jgi:hypothetical protein
VFSEIFLVQIRRKFRKIHSKVRIQGKKNFEKRIPKFKTRSKNENPEEGGKSHGGGKRKFHALETQQNRAYKPSGPLDKR